MLGDRAWKLGQPLSRGERFALTLLLLLGAAFLTYRFPAVPAGLHQDELSEAYESYALLHTGADRWGYHLPVYFLSWGSGQNVLQAYLNIPFVAILGLSRVSARLLPLLLNLFCLPLFFVAVRRWYGSRPALLALCFLALSPWHVMLSRWGIENSPLPFFLAWGFWAIRWALDRPTRWRILACLLPFVCLQYTYGVMVLVVPIYILLLYCMNIGRLKPQKFEWAVSLIVFLVMCAPVYWFTLKNNVFHKNFAFETHLPFTAPLLAASRLDQARHDLGDRPLIATNLRYLGHLFNDGRIGQPPWYQLAAVHGVPPIVAALALLSVIALCIAFLRTHQFSDPFLAGLLAFAPLVFIIPLNSSRAGFVFLPILALAAAGSWFIWEQLHSKSMRFIFSCTLAMFLFSSMVRFSLEYYSHVYAAELATTFWPSMPEALADVQAKAGTSMPIYVSDNVALNYVDVLFMDRIDPILFQHSGATWKDPDFANFRFSRSEVASIPKPFAFLLTAPDADICLEVNSPRTFGNIRTGICTR